jgi:hypothetical protein
MWRAMEPHGGLLSWLAVRRPERYRLRAPASGREAVVAVDGAGPDEEVGYYDQLTGERMDIVGKLVPTANSPSNLPRAPENLRICPHCDQLVGRDLSDCPYCRRRLPALERRP